MTFSRELSVICCAAVLLMATPGIAAAQNGLAAQQAAAARARAVQQAAAQAAAARAKAAQQAAAQAAAARAKAAQQAAAQAAAAKAKAAQQAAAQASPQKLKMLPQPKVVSPKPNGIQPKITAPNVAQPKVFSSKPNIIQPKIAAPKPAVVAPTVAAQKPTGGTPSGGEAGGSGSSGGGSVAANPGRTGDGAAAGITGAAVLGLQMLVSPNLTPANTSSASQAGGGNDTAPTSNTSGLIKVTLPTQHLDMGKPSGGEAGGSGSSGGDSDAAKALKQLERLMPHLTMQPVIPPPTTDRTTTAINSNQAIPLATTDRTVATTLNPVARLATEPTQDIRITLPTQQPPQHSTAAPSNQAIPLVTTPLATTDSTIATPFNSTHLAPSTVLNTLNLPTLNADSKITPRAQSLATTFSADQLTNAPSASLNPSAPLDVSATKGVLLNTPQEKSGPDLLTGYTGDWIAVRHPDKNVLNKTKYVKWCTSGNCFWLPDRVDPSQRYIQGVAAKEGQTNHEVVQALEAQKVREALAAQKAQEALDASLWNGTLAPKPQTVIQWLPTNGSWFFLD